MESSKNQNKRIEFRGIMGFGFISLLLIIFFKSPFLLKIGYVGEIISSVILGIALASLYRLGRIVEKQLQQGKK